MKNHKLCITFCMSFILMLACNKEHPPEGLYIGKFYGNGMDKTNLSFDIIETNEKYIILKGEGTATISVLEKNGKKITGRLYNAGFNPLIEVDVVGTWKKSGKHYIISGTFTGRYKIATGPQIYEFYPAIGTFELKSYAI